MGTSREVFDRAIDAENRGDLEQMAQCWAADAVRIDPLRTLRGREAIVEFYRRGREMMPDLHITVDNTVEEGNSMAWEVVVTGTQTGPLHLPNGRTLPPTGRRQEQRFAGFSQVRDGQCVFLRIYFDQVELRRQLGFAPTPAPAIAGMLRSLWASRVGPRLLDRAPR